MHACTALVRRGCHKNLASSRRSVTQGAAQKTAREKNKKRGERKLPLAAHYFIFPRAVFCAVFCASRPANSCLVKSRFN